jgi:hypothetical protein
MGLATHLGPWLLGTVRSTTGTTAGSIRNLGATVVHQSKTIAYNDAAASQLCVVPAGSILLSAFLIPTTAFTSGSTATLQLFVNASAVTGTVTTSTGTTTSIALPLGTSNPGLVANVGSSDAIITYTSSTATAGAGVIVLQYVVRQPDGTYVPTSSTGP